MGAPCVPNEQTHLQEKKKLLHQLFETDEATLKVRPLNIADPNRESVPLQNENI